MPDTAGNLGLRKHDDALVMRACTLTHCRAPGTELRMHAIAPALEPGLGFLIPSEHRGAISLESPTGRCNTNLSPWEHPHRMGETERYTLGKLERRRGKRVCGVYRVKDRDRQKGKQEGEKAAHYLCEESGEEQPVCRMISISFPGCLGRYYCSVVYSTLAR